MKKKIDLIGLTQHAAKDWGKDAEGIPVIPDSVINRAEVVLRCSLKGEPRRPPLPGDFDVDDTCRCCGAHIIKRNSAPKHALALCPKCWDEEASR